jgi:hypothetical protein
MLERRRECINPCLNSFLGLECISLRTVPVVATFSVLSGAQKADISARENVPDEKII